MTDYYASPRWTGELADCSMPMTFDQYSNCTFGCIYCFSQYQRAIGGAKKNYLNKTFKGVSVKNIKKMFTVPGSSQFWPYIEKKMWMQWGGLSDPFDPMERKYGVGLELLKFFKSINYPICFSTKAVWWLDDPRYTELFKDQKNWNVKVSIITLDERKAKEIEVGVSSPEKRLSAIKKITDLNAGGATLRLRPFIIGVSDPRHVELIKRSSENGATALSTEFFCLEMRSHQLKKKMHIFNRLCGFDVAKFYKRYSVSSGYLRLNRNIKRKFVDEMQNACREHNMRFYVSDAHFKERCDNGSCCGLAETCNYSRGQFTEALVLARKNGSVTWPEISINLGHLKDIQYGRAAGFNTNSAERRSKFLGKSLFDYMAWLWNNPNAGQSPYKLFEGILKPTGKDANGDLIYIIDPARS